MGRADACADDRDGPGGPGESSDSAVGAVEPAGLPAWGQRVVLADAAATVAFGRSLAAALRPGDVVVLTGELGAGKTTLTTGLAQGLGVRGPVTSPTFVIAREHPSLVGGPALVHVDAYRLAGPLELEDLDVATAAEDAVIVLEWGRGMAEAVSDSYLEVVLDRPGGPVSPDADCRTATVSGHGPRWAGAGG